jgi:uncharacterized protein (DUF2345 family)
MRQEHAATALALPGGHDLIVERGEGWGRLLLRGPRGSTLTIEVTAAGPVLRFDGPTLSVEAAGELAIRAETVSIEARNGLSLAAGGDARVAVGGDLEIAAHAQTLRARAGDVQVVANDDVKLNGERVLLNC